MQEKAFVFVVVADVIRSNFQ